MCVWRSQIRIAWRALRSGQSRDKDNVTDEWRPIYIQYLGNRDNHLRADSLSPSPSYALGSLHTPGTDFQSWRYTGSRGSKGLNWLKKPWSGFVKFYKTRAWHRTYVQLKKIIKRQGLHTCVESLRFMPTIK